jgi:hypothetical protein
MDARLATPAVWLALMSHQLGRDSQVSDGLAQDVAGRCHSDGAEGCSSWFSFATRASAWAAE